jgi:hypothetical protein
VPSPAASQFTTTLTRGKTFSALAQDPRLRPLQRDDTRLFLHAALASHVAAWESYVERLITNFLAEIIDIQIPKFVALHSIIQPLAETASQRFNTPNWENTRLLLIRHTGYGTIEGADVRVSIVCFGESRPPYKLDGHEVSEIYSDLAAGTSNIAIAKPLRANKGISFQGVIKTGKFDIPGELARKWLELPKNPNHRSNADVLKPWYNGDDITDRWSDHWIVDFGVATNERDAALYEAPFAYLKAEVFEKRKGKREKRASERWWLLQRSRPEMRKALSGLNRFIATPRVAKHRIFIWLRPPVLPDTRLVVVALDSDCMFGLLHSRFHEAWTLRLGGWHGVGNDPQYTPTLGLATFPFPDALSPDIPAGNYKDDPRAVAIANTAKRLDKLRNVWLNPPELINVVPEVVPGYPDRILPRDDEAAAELKNRTLTNLYNARPQWLADAHRDLDAAVAAAYGWAADISDEDALTKLLELNASGSRRRMEGMGKECPRIRFAVATRRRSAPATSRSAHWRA